VIVRVCFDHDRGGECECFAVAHSLTVRFVFTSRFARHRNTVYKMYHGLKS